jgi:hypothetical protein
VRSWTDFLKVRLHPRSVALLSGRWQGAEDFSGFGHGRGALVGDEAREDALDRIRGFAEECDSLQVSSIASTSRHTLSHISRYITAILTTKNSKNTNGNHVICCVTFKPEFSGCVVKPRDFLTYALLEQAVIASTIWLSYTMARRCTVSARKIDISSAPCASCVAPLKGQGKWLDTLEDTCQGWIVRCRVSSTLLTT